MTDRRHGTAAGTVRRPPRRGTAAGGGAVSEAAAARAVQPWMVALALVVGHLALALLTFDPTPHTGGDNAAYISLARSLLERGTYQELYDPGLPAHTQYPPVFPGILALAILMGLGAWVGLKMVVVAFSGVAIGFTYLWARRHSGPGVALGVALLLALSPVVLDLAHWVLSDVPFWAFTILALWAFDAIDRRWAERAGGAGGTDGAERASGRAVLVVAIAATVLAYFTRSAGLPLAIAAGGWLGLRRRWRELALLALALLPLAGWWWLRAKSLGGVDYVNQFWWVNPYDPELGRIGAGGLVQRVIDNIGNYIGIHLPLLLIGRTGALAVTASVVLSLAALAGWVMRVRRPGVAELFFPLYLGLILVWPAVWSGERFLLPAYPLVLVYGAESLRWVARRVRPAAVVPAGVGATALVLLLAAPNLLQGFQLSSTCTALYRAGDPYPCLPPVWRDFYEIAEWAGESLPDDAVVISRKPRLFYGLSARRGLIYPFSTEPAEFFEAVRASGARYLVLDQLGGTSARYLGPVLDAYPHAFCFLHTTTGGNAALLGIRPESEWAFDVANPDQEAGFTACPADYLRLPRAE